MSLHALDSLRDIQNMVHANDVASQAEKDVTIRRASGFNHLFEAVLNKEFKQDRSEHHTTGLGLGGQEIGGHAYHNPGHAFSGMDGSGDVGAGVGGPLTGSERHPFTTMGSQSKVIDLTMVHSI